MLRPNDDIYRPYTAQTKAVTEVPLLDALAVVLEPSTRAIEQVRLADHHEPLALVTRRSFQTHQDANNQYGQRIAQHTWAILNKCTPGTADAERCRRKYLDKGAPELGYYAVVNSQERTLAGLYAELFSDLVEDVRYHRRDIPQLSATSLIFLHDLAEVVEAELQG